MTAFGDLRAAARPRPLAASSRFRTFALVCAVAAPAIYVLCEMRNWPLFTYHPGTDRFDWFYAPAVRDEGPAMYWYGWVVNTIVGATLLGCLATLLPDRLARRIPLAAAWLPTLAAIPLLVYALRYYWRW